MLIRDGPKVERFRFESLADALAEMEDRLDALAPDARRPSVEIIGHRYDPARQVAVRAEVTGPGGLLGAARGGVDMRGDGSTEAYLGRLRRRLLELRPGETPYEGLRRALGEAGAG
jgi:hypothetical protein